MLTPDQIKQAEDAAEEIIMAAEVGRFHGTRGEYANALLVIAAREARELSDVNATAMQLRDAADEEAIERARHEGNY